MVVRDSKRLHADILANLVIEYVNARIKFADIHKRGTEVRERTAGIYDSKVKHNEIEDITGTEFRKLRDNAREFSSLEADHHRR